MKISESSVKNVVFLKACKTMLRILEIVHINYIYIVINLQKTSKHPTSKNHANMYMYLQLDKMNIKISIQKMYMHH